MFSLQSAALCAMSNLAPAIPLQELGRRPHARVLNTYDIRFLSNNSEFQSIRDDMTQMLFLREFALVECLAHIKAKILAIVYQIRGTRQIDSFQKQSHCRRACATSASR
jgi:hypothetical protein